MFVHYEVRGSYSDKDAEGNTVIRSVKGHGVVKADRAYIGSIFKQNPELNRCDSIDVTTRLLSEY